MNAYNLMSDVFKGVVEGQYHIPSLHKMGAICIYDMNENDGLYICLCGNDRGSISWDYHLGLFDSPSVRRQIELAAEDVLDAEVIFRVANS